MVWRMGKLTVAMLISLATPVILPVPSPAQTGAAATLSVLAPPVERVAPAGTSVGVDGMNLAEGDRIKTGAKGLALITFLDGSTVTVLSDAEATHIGALCPCGRGVPCSTARATGILPGGSRASGPHQCSYAVESTR